MTRKPVFVALLGCIPIAVVFFFILCLHPAPHPAPSGLDERPELNKAFIDQLSFLWQRYLDMVQLLITLLTGTLALSTGLVKFEQGRVVAAREFFAFGAGALLVGLCSAVLWRIDAQLLMEIEIFGDPGKTQAVFASHGVPSPFTSSFNYADRLQAYGVAAKVLMVGTATGLVVGLLLLSIFAFRNLGAHPPATALAPESP